MNKENHSAVLEKAHSVKADLMRRIYFALETARDNALECFNAHMANIKGIKTVEEMDLAKLLLNDVSEAVDLIKVLTDKYGKF